MSDQPSRDYRSLMILAAILALVGWPGLLLLVNFTLPTLGPRWMFFFLLVLGVTGVSLPLIWLLHRRFISGPPAGSGVLLRQSLFAGLYAGLCAWLLFNAALERELALLLGVGLIALEWFIRLLERNAWRPG